MTIPRPTIMSLHGMVAAAHPLAAEAGAGVLERGGNAFDAAAATAATLNVVEPFMSGLAGLGYATAWVAKEQRVRVLDFVGAIPKSFQAERFSKREELWRGALAVMPPGNLAGWCELVSRYGSRPLSELFEPAAAIAQDGVPLAEFGCHEIEETRPQLEAHPDIYPEWAKTYWAADRTLTPGTVLRQPDLARTFRELGREGPGYFYGGPLGARIAAHVQALGGTLTEEDIAAVSPVWREPLAVSFRGLEVHLPPPPCEGFQFALTLKVLEGLDLAAMERNGLDHLDTVLRTIRLAAGLRIAHNDPDAETLARLLSDDAVAALGGRVRDGRPVVGPTEQWMPEAAFQGEDPGHTTSFSIADREGNVVCVTQSIGSPFGSGVVVPGTGICLNNFLFWADVQPGSPSRAKPGAALPMCMSPTVSTRAGRPVLALGTPGSYGILQTQAQALVQHLVYGLPIQAAIEAPRCRLWDERLVEIEPRISAEVVAGLRERGHEARHFPADWSWRCGGLHAVAIDPETGVMTGAADPRRDGIAAAVGGVH